VQRIACGWWGELCGSDTVRAFWTGRHARLLLQHFVRYLRVVVNGEKRSGYPALCLQTAPGGGQSASRRLSMTLDIVVRHRGARNST